MDNQVIEKVVSMFESSNKWAQSSNTAFFEFVIGENKRLKDEIVHLKRTSDERQSEMVETINKLRRKVKKFKQNRVDNACHQPSAIETIPLYQPTPISEP
ncbi:hypothetical protein ACF0H5_001782 [Mactra antiquata]